MSYLPSNPVDPALFDYDAVKELGKELHETYAAGDPFPHVAIDNFLPEALVDLCLDKFPGRADPDSVSFDRSQERFKTSYHPDYMEPALRRLFYSMNSRPFIKIIANRSISNGALTS